MSTIKINDRVSIVGRNVSGTIAFKGRTEFSTGLWYGVILDEPKGRNNGIYDGIRYFKCPRNHGIFLREYQIIKLPEKNESSHARCIQSDSSLVPSPILPKKETKSCDSENKINYDSSTSAVDSKAMKDSAASASKSSLSVLQDEEKRSSQIINSANTDLESQENDAKSIEVNNETKDSTNPSNSESSEDFLNLLKKAIEEKRISDIKELIQKQDIKLQEVEEYIRNFKEKFPIE